MSNLSLVVLVITLIKELVNLANSAIEMIKRLKKDSSGSLAAKDESHKDGLHKSS